AFFLERQADGVKKNLGFAFGEFDHSRIVCEGLSRDVPFMGHQLVSWIRQGTEKLPRCAGNDSRFSSGALGSSGTVKHVPFVETIPVVACAPGIRRTVTQWSHAATFTEIRLLESEYLAALFNKLEITWSSRTDPKRGPVELNRLQPWRNEP